MDLEGVVNITIKKYKKIMVTGDYHIPYLNDKAYQSMIKYAKVYKPDMFIILGDFLDFYGISTFDKRPDRKGTTKDELIEGRKCLKDLRQAMPKAEMYLLEGNHENRLQRFMWNNPEFSDLDELSIKNLLHLKKHNITFIKADRDYWKKDTGHLKLGDTIIMHGDSRLNGASLSKYSGYSVKNTMLNGLQQNVIMGHCHRLAKIYHTTKYSNLIGLETGCLCNIPGNANWQQGFVTFEFNRGKMINPCVYQILNGKLMINGKHYNARRK